MPTKYDKDTRARAIRLVRDHASDYDTEWAAIREISARLDERGDATQVAAPGRGGRRGYLGSQGPHHHRGPGSQQAPDLVKRHFKADSPGQLHVAGFTYVPMTCGFGYTAFVIDAYAGLIPGWECSLSKETAFVERAIRQAADFRARQGHPLRGAIHHSDYAEVGVKPRNRGLACSGGAG